jgi:hypothetical protein
MNATQIFEAFRQLTPAEKVEFFQAVAADPMLPFAVREIAAEASRELKRIA